MVPIARRMLFTDRRRALLGVAGVSVALVMALTVDGIFAGVTRQLSTYIDNSPAEVFVSQEGVLTMHMAISALPLDVVGRAQEVPGVAWAEPILFSGDTLRTAGERRPTYVFGFTPGGRGGPDNFIEGGPPGAGEVVIDDSAAEALDVAVGDQVEVLGQTWRVSGLTSGAGSIINTAVFVTFDDLARTLQWPAAASYILIGTEGDPEGVAERLKRAIPGIEAQTRLRFSSEERTVVKEMSTDLLAIMSLAAFLVGLAVIGLVLYAVVLSRLRDIGVMKALGMGRFGTTRLLMAQALWTVVSALSLAVAFTFAIGAVVSSLAEIDLVVEASSMVRVFAGSIVVATVGVIAPLIKVWRVDPASVSRRTL